MSQITIRPRTPADDERFLAIRNTIGPDRAPVTVEEHRRAIALEPERAEQRIVVAERGGEILGQAAWLRRIFTAEADTFWMNLMVDPEHWGTGIGRALYGHVLCDLQERSARKVYGSVREDQPDAEAWATRRGFVRTGHGDRISRLDVQNANLEKSRAAAQRAEADGIRISTLADIGIGEDVIGKLRDLDESTSRDIPGEEDYVGMPAEEFKRFFMEMPGMSPDIFWVALDGDEIIGMALLQRRGEQYADNAYTAVARAYRGRGIARALKLRTVEWAQQNRVRYIITGNDPANKPMLAINIDLGYQFLPANIQLVKEL